jgi:hypothetical protein
VPSTTEADSHPPAADYLEVDPEAILDSDEAFEKVMEALEWSDLDSAEELRVRAESLDAIVEDATSS